MLTLKKFLLVMLIGMAAGPSLGGMYNEVLSINDAAPDWSNLPGVDGKNHSLADFRDADVLVVVFTCNSCPYAVDYEDRLVALSAEFKKTKTSAAIVAINVNKIPEDNLDAMKKRAEEKKFDFPYLFDETQKVAKDYGALRTPEFFVFNKDRKLVYTGAMDDSSDATKVTKEFVRPAIENSLKGVPASPSETPPVGCAIRFERPKRAKRP